MVDSPSIIYALSCSLDKKSNWPLKFGYTKLLSNPPSFMAVKHGQWELGTLADLRFSTSLFTPSCSLAKFHLYLCNLCTMQNLLSLVGSSYVTSSLAWLCSVLTTRWFHPRIYLSSPSTGLEEMPWWPTENMAQNREARCGINLGPVLVWNSPLESQVVDTHLIDSFGLLCLVSLHSRCEFVGHNWLHQLMVNAVTYTVC